MSFWDIEIHNETLYILSKNVCRWLMKKCQANIHYEYSCLNTEQNIIKQNLPPRLKKYHDQKGVIQKDPKTETASTAI